MNEYMPYSPLMFCAVLFYFPTNLQYTTITDL